MGSPRCRFCGREFRSEYELRRHYHDTHEIEGGETGGAGPHESAPRDRGDAEGRTPRAGGGAEARAPRDGDGAEGRPPRDDGGAEGRPPGS